MAAFILFFHAMLSSGFSNGLCQSVGGGLDNGRERLQRTSVSEAGLRGHPSPLIPVKDTLS